MAKFKREQETPKVEETHASSEEKAEAPVVSEPAEVPSKLHKFEGKK